MKTKESPVFKRRLSDENMKKLISKVESFALRCPYGPKLKIYVEKYAEELSVISTLWFKARQTSCKTSCKLSTSERVIQMATNALMTCFMISKSFFKRRFVKSIHSSFSFWMTKWQQMLGISAGLNSNLLSLGMYILSM